MTTGEKIENERKKLSLTQQQFADKLGVTRQAVSRWESDLAFPETDTLLKMSEMFGCSVDYLLKYNNGGDASAEDRERDKSDAAESDGSADGGGRLYGNILKGFSLSDLPYFEYKSKTTLFGVPLVHVNIGLGRVAKGIFSFGLVSVGVVSAGLVSVGALAFGTVALGLVSLGAISLGLLIALGAVAIGGFIALGGVAIGCFGMGGCSIGLFACGGYANGRFVAVGDYAVGQIAFGDSTANGSLISVTKETFAEQKARAWELIDKLPAFWKGFANCIKNLAQSFMTAKS